MSSRRIQAMARLIDSMEDRINEWYRNPRYWATSEAEALEYLESRDGKERPRLVRMVEALPPETKPPSHCPHGEDPVDCIGCSNDRRHAREQAAFKYVRPVWTPSKSK